LLIQKAALQKQNQNKNKKDNLITGVNSSSILGELNNTIPIPEL